MASTYRSSSTPRSCSARVTAPRTPCGYRHYYTYYGTSHTKRMQAHHSYPRPPRPPALPAHSDMVSENWLLVAEGRLAPGSSGSGDRGLNSQSVRFLPPHKRNLLESRRGERPTQPEKHRQAAVARPAGVCGVRASALVEDRVEDAQQPVLVHGRQ
eukprot:scaffold2103_cov60-Phaeocystis_antarctica.AAC.1